jgi:hypothetical protein
MEAEASHHRATYEVILNQAAVKKDEEKVRGDFHIMASS